MLALPLVTGCGGGAALPSGKAAIDWDRLDEAKRDAKPSKDEPSRDDPKKSDGAKRWADDRPSETKPSKDKEEKTPQIWKRDRAQPTFARVYVGDNNSLELVSLQVTVQIEGPRARTVVDHIFRNPHPRQLEGTFEYPLPAGASPSYFAMFLGQTRDSVPQRFGRRGDTPPSLGALSRFTPEELVKRVDVSDWGTLQQGRVVAQDKARETYEEVVRGRIDPALLEYAGGNTFRGRVFPIPAQGYNRVLIAYEELLPVVKGRMVYRFALPDRELTELSFSLQSAADECLAPVFQPGEARKEEGNGKITFTRTWSRSKPSGQVVFSCIPAQPRVQAISGRQGGAGPTYLYTRLRPEVPVVGTEQPFARHAVFLLDTSLSEHPDRFNVSMQLLRAILEKDADLESFNVVAFNAGAAWVEPNGWLPNTAAGREKLFAALDGLVLEGATSLSAALDKLIQPGFAIKAGTPLNVFLLSDGNLTWGETSVAPLVARFEERCPYPCHFFCYRTGLGAENAELYEALTRRGGGIFQCYGKADVANAAQAHRSQCLQVERVRFEGDPAASDVIVAGRQMAVYPGGELIVAARFRATGTTKLIVEGTFRGKKQVQSFPITVGGDSELAPRGWGEVAVASLLALHDPRLDRLVTAYCQQFDIASRVASFLVLEREDDYRRFKVEDERHQVLKGDLGVFLSDVWATLGKAMSARQAFDQFLERIEPRLHLRDGRVGAEFQKLIALLGDSDFELPADSLPGALLHEKDADADYLRERRRSRRSVRVYLAEAARRAEAGDADGAVRVLSSVIEEHPSRSDALRLVGYRLLDLKQGAAAIRLFHVVEQQRPFEPHSYRDLARSLEDQGRYALAAVHYEIVLAGTWHNRFRDSLKVVAEEEYVRMMREAVRKKAVSHTLADHFAARINALTGWETADDLRVSITWNTDDTDVDLWVIEPDGTKCFYSHARTKNGGELSQDQTQGYGPERYRTTRALSGAYRVVVHNFRANPNLLGGTTHVHVVVTRFAGTPRERVEHYTVVLDQPGQVVEVCRVKF
jgi:tetratricopeptide (TPR) repeat protein